MLNYQDGAAPCMRIEPANPLPYQLGLADYPQSAWTTAASSALFSRNDYATAQSYEYASDYPLADWVTWDYASPFLYVKPALQPYPYVLIGP